MGGSSADLETIASWELSWCQSPVEFPCLRHWLMSLWCRCRASPPYDVRHRFASKPSHAIAWSAVWVSTPSMPKEYCDEYWMRFLWKDTHIHTQTQKQNKAKRNLEWCFHVNYTLTVHRGHHPGEQSCRLETEAVCEGKRCVLIRPWAVEKPPVWTVSTR